MASRTFRWSFPPTTGPRLLGDAVASVLTQDVPVEVIVVDDASIPAVAGLPAVRRPPGQGDQERAVAIGPTRARNLGVELASGAFVAFLDDDDTWLPGKLSRCLEILDAADGVGVVAHRTVFDARQANGTRSDIRVVTDPLTRFGLQQTPHLDGVVVDARLAKEVGFDESLDAAQDVDFIIELARKSPFAMVDDALALRGARWRAQRHRPRPADRRQAPAARQAPRRAVPGRSQPVVLPREARTPVPARRRPRPCHTQLPRRHQVRPRTGTGLAGHRPHPAARYRPSPGSVVERRARAAR